MKLDQDCVRDILFVTEEHSNFSIPVADTTYFEKLGNKYSQEKILYHLRQCYLSDLITDFSRNYEGYSVFDLSPEGHKFLSDIRNDNNWNKTKEVATNIGSTSISAFKDIASQVIAELISRQFNR